MKSKPRICVTCGTTYEYCPKCTKDADKPVWMVALQKNVEKYITLLLNTILVM